MFREVLDELQSTVTNDCYLGFTSFCECTQCFLDAKLLRQILTNLISNAIKYSPKGGTVSLQLACEENNIIFSCSDEGIGIPSEDLQNLFESFTRASNVDTIAGIGLGLSIVKKCVDLHRGQLTVESEVGIGTKFTIRMPHNKNECIGI